MSLRDRLGDTDGEGSIETEPLKTWQPDASDTEAMTVRMSDAQPLQLTLGQPAPLTGAYQPEWAGLLLRCATCGIWLRAEGPIAWEYIDDDHFGYSDNGFMGTLHGACPECGRSRHTQVRLTITRSRADDTAELVWDSIQDT